MRTSLGSRASCGGLSWSRFPLSTPRAQLDIGPNAALGLSGRRTRWPLGVSAQGEAGAWSRPDAVDGAVQVVQFSRALGRTRHTGLQLGAIVRRATRMQPNALQRRGSGRSGSMVAETASTTKGSCTRMMSGDLPRSVRFGRTRHHSRAKPPTEGWSPRRRLSASPESTREDPISKRPFRAVSARLSFPRCGGRGGGVRRARGCSDDVRPRWTNRAPRACAAETPPTPPRQR
jgi:hypothetical protein